MEQKTARSKYLFNALLLLAIVSGIGLPFLLDWRASREGVIVWEEIIRKLHAPDHNEEGWWVGDMAGLYPLGRKSREVAEADTAPIQPLAPRPVPFHGYFVRALEYGPTRNWGDDHPVLLKGKTRSRESFAICVYPADATSNLDTRALGNRRLIRAELSGVSLIRLAKSCLVLA